MAKRQILKAARISFFSHIAGGIQKQARGNVEVQLDSLDAEDAFLVVGSPDMRQTGRPPNFLTAKQISSYGDTISNITKLPHLHACFFYNYLVCHPRGISYTI